jgi:hypothetical protein
MRRVLVVAGVVVCAWSTTAHAQYPCAGSLAEYSGGHIGLYSDSPGYSDCSLRETLYTTNTVYIVHTIASHGNTAQFRIIHNWNALPQAISFGSNLTLGDVYTGITVTYVGCKPLPYLIGTLSFIPLTPTPRCTAFKVLPDPAVPSGQIEVVDCSYQIHAATGGELWVNTECMMCGLPEGCDPVAAETTSWGRVKALYH